MLIAVNDCGRVSLSRGNVLGHTDENRLRVHRIIHPKFENAYYNLILESGGVQKVLQIVDGTVTVERSAIAAAGEVNAQFRAVVMDGVEVCVFRSDIFKLKVLPSLQADK